MMRRILTYVASLGIVMLFAGCAAPKQVGYAAFKQARPRSIVVLSHGQLFWPNGRPSGASR
ncbi:hypothetical protein D9M68_675100 [compost metagenome]